MQQDKSPMTEQQARELLKHYEECFQFRDWQTIEYIEDDVRQARKLLGFED